MADKSQYAFNISLSVLNHLGRNLYRNFVTVLGEAISNSWDADANNVWIYIDRDKSELVIKDDGIGMSADDFRDKFLKVGYTKRGIDGRVIDSPQGRPYIGRKGIGKLALLSCAKKVSIISKTKTGSYLGGTIDNSNLDRSISENDTKYNLEEIDFNKFTPFLEDHSKGTIIVFEGIHDEIKKSEDYLRKILALYFRFSLIDNTFHIHLDEKEVTVKDLKALAEKTEFLWTINTLDDPYISEELTKLKRTNVLTPEMEFTGFIASVEKPRYLKITDTEEKTGIDLFVNGRLREHNILKHMADFSTRHIASYLYGQIHFNKLDGVGEDSFTTSRESIKEGSSEYGNLLDVLKNEVLEKIDKEWDIWREEVKEDGDDENPRRSKIARRARSLYNYASQDYLSDMTNEEVNRWIDELQPDADFNIPAYVSCFLSENLLRMHIEKNRLTPGSCINVDPQGKTCCERYHAPENTSLCAYCKGERGRLSLIQQKADAGTSIRIRNAEESLLVYLVYLDLAMIINNKILKDEDKPYKPLRNSVMHTARLTEEAKTKLTSVFDNVVATVKKLIGSNTRR